MTDRFPRVVSLRVPGVEHASADPVLDALPSELVDDVSSRGEFWRRRPDRPRPTDPRHITEAYLWGVRSGPTTRALWMLLLPFTLMNVAYWARPARQRGIVSWVADNAVSITCRLLALTLTCTLMLAATGVTLDLIAWECLGSGTECTDSWAQPFDLIGELTLTAGQRLAAAAAVPLGLLWMLWALSYSAWRRSERRVSIEPQAADRLTDARFWRGRAWVERLRACHVLAGMAIVDASVTYPVHLADRGGLAVVGAVLLGLCAVAMATAALGVVVPLPLASPTVKADRDGWTIAALRRFRRLAVGVQVYSWAADQVDLLIESTRARARTVGTPVTWAVRAAAGATVVLTGVCMLYAALPRTGFRETSGPLPGYPATVATLSVVQTVLLLALGAAVVPLARLARRTRGRLPVHGFVAPIVATIAIMFGVGESAGTLYFAALLIGQLRTSPGGRVWEPAPPYPYQWAGLVFLVAIAAIVLAAGVHHMRWRALVRAGARKTDALDPTLRAHDHDIVDTLDRAHARGRVLETVPVLVLLVFVPMASLSFVGVVYSAFGRGPDSVLPAQQVVTNLGTWSIGLVAAILVVGGMRAGMMTPVRGLISAVWAMATFWPRAAHPFGAPAHGPRAVADLVLRINRLTGHGRRVLLAGHSHGALLAATAVLYLPPEALRHTALLTSATPMSRLIEPYFGAFYHQGVFHDVADRLTDERGTRWRNLYRITDPIGGPVFRVPRSCGPGSPSGIDVPVPDPDLADLHDGTDATPLGHGHYLHNRVFLAAHQALAEQLAR